MEVGAEAETVFLDFFVAHLRDEGVEHGIALSKIDDIHVIPHCYSKDKYSNNSASGKIIFRRGWDGR